MKFLFMLLFVSASLYAQEGIHAWKSIVINDKEKAWYDQSNADSIKGGKLNVWVLQMYKPPLTAEGIKGGVFRSKILYSINLKTAKYGIMHVIYYDANNKEMNNFKYDIDAYPESLRYSYPITEQSILFTLIKQIFNKTGENSN